MHQEQIDRLKKAKQAAYRQARMIGATHSEAKDMAQSVGRQIALTHALAENPDDVKSKIEMEFHRNFVRLFADDGEKVWYARAAASVAATEYAISIGYVPNNWGTSIRNAGVVAEANCDGTDEEAAQAREAGRAEMAHRLEEAARNGAVKA